MKIIVYTTKNCPKCKTLKGELTKLNINFTESDMTTPESQTELVSNGVFTLSAPVLQVGDRFYKTTDIFAGEKIKSEIKAIFEWVKMSLSQI